VEAVRIVAVTLGLAVVAVLVLAVVTRVAARARRHRDSSQDRSVSGQER
jgi:hypothetical protein